MFVPQMISASHAPVVSYIPAGVSTSPDVPEATSPYNYSLYPFLSPRALPWYMNTSGAFRVRRVGQWLSTSQGEDVNATGGLAGGKGQFLTVNKLSSPAVYTADNAYYVFLVKV